MGADASRPRAEILDYFSRYEVRGGFPELARIEDADEVRRRLREFCEKHVLDSDVVRRLRIRQNDTLARLWLHLVRNPGQILNPAQLGNETGAKRETVEGWLRAL